MLDAVAATAAGVTARIPKRPSRRPRPPSGGIAIVGEFGGASGLAESARLMNQALPHIGVSTWPLDAAGVGATPAPFAEGSPLSPPPPGVPIVIHANANRMDNALRALPRSLIRGRRIIGYWAWELPVVPRSWQPGVRFVHEVWVPSHFVARAIATILPASGSIPIRIVPHPVAAVPPCPAAMDRAAFGLPKDAVIVLVSLNLASNVARKNPYGAINAFRQAFGARTDRVLVLKLGNIDEFPADFVRLWQTVADSPNIHIEARSFSIAVNHAFTRCADIVLSLHRSEGFGLVMAEAMMLGCPVVATGWSGNMDFMDSDSAALVGVTMVEPTDDRGVFTIPGARWAEPDIGEAVAQLRRLADDAAERKALGARGRAMAQMRLTTAKLAEAVRALGLPARE